MSSPIVPIRILPGTGIDILDQTLLPHVERRLVLGTVAAVAEAIRSLRVRGAPLLGVVGVCGMAIAGEERGVDAPALGRAGAELKATRPTAVDLGAMIDEAIAVAEGAGSDARARREALWAFAETALARQHARDAAIARYGEGLPGLAGGVLTHCNTGALATGGRGTALAVIAAAAEGGESSAATPPRHAPCSRGPVSRCGSSASSASPERCCRTPPPPRSSLRARWVS